MLWSVSERSVRERQHASQTSDPLDWCFYKRGILNTLEGEFFRGLCQTKPFRRRACDTIWIPGKNPVCSCTSDKKAGKSAAASKRASPISSSSGALETRGRKWVTLDFKLQEQFVAQKKDIFGIITPNNFTKCVSVWPDKLSRGHPWLVVEKINHSGLI